MYRTVILPVVLYGCETWSLTLGNGQRRVIRNRILMNLCEPRREEASGNS